MNAHCRARLLCAGTVVAIAQSVAHAPIAIRELRREIGPCQLERVQGKVDCGVFEVYENPDYPSGRTILLYFVVLRALEQPARPDPIIGFAGGPGLAEASLAWAWDEAWTFARRTRDIILFDQRGTGKSHSLSCSVPEKASTLAFQLTLFPPDLVARCRDRLVALADLTRYTTPYVVRDVDQLRDWLGYPKINLWGESYGSRAALHYLREFPTHVRAVIVDGVAGFALKMPLYFAADAQRALDSLFADCRRAEPCNRSYPRVTEEFDSLVRRLAVRSELVVLHDSAGRDTANVTLTRAGFGYAVRGMLYGPAALRLPMLIHDAYHEGAWEPFAVSYLRRGSWFGRDGTGGVYLSIVCAEDVAAIRDTEVQGTTNATFLGDALVKQYRDACELWPHGRVPAGYEVPVQSDVPVLLLSGGRDPVTPPGIAIRQAKALRNSLHFVVPQGGHGVGAFTCAEQLTAEFLELGRAPPRLPTCDRKEAGSFVIRP